MRAMVAVFLVLTLAGCSATDEPPAPGSVRALFWPGDTNSLYAARAEASCRAIGLDEKSEKWSDCLIEMLAAEKRSHDAAISKSPKSEQGQQKLSFMCKDAIQRGDAGAISLFC